MRVGASAQTSTAGFLPSPSACLSLMWDLGPGVKEACSHSSLDSHSEEALHIFTMEVIFQLSSLAANIFHKYFSVEISGKEFVGRHRLLSCLGSYAFSSVQTCLLTFYENLRCFLLVHFCDGYLLSLLL